MGDEEADEDDQFNAQIGRSASGDDELQTRFSPLRGEYRRSLDGLGEALRGKARNIIHMPRLERARQRQGRRTDSDEEDDEGQEESGQSSGSSDSSSSDEENGCGSPISNIAPKGTLLGPAQDRAKLADMVGRFRRDDLADPDDPVEAAVWMQVHQLSGASDKLHILFSCGLWLIFRPQEDFGALLLTSKGRIIHYGKSRTAQPSSTGRYLLQVLAALAGLTLLVIVVVSLGHNVQSLRVMFGDKLWVVQLYAVAAVLLVACLAYTHRPRSDCGSTFRQHFEVRDLCASSYGRVDSGRRLRFSCAKRRRGNLCMAFSRICPDAATLEAGLPPDAPSVGSVSPVQSLPAAMAGEQTIVAREKADAKRHSSSFGPCTTALLACLGMLGASYEYTEFVRRSYEHYKVCARKVAGCDWRVDNSVLVGRQRTVRGAFPPNDYASGNCSEEGEFCDSYWKPEGACLADMESIDVTGVKVSCEDIPSIWQNLCLDSYKDTYGRSHVRYIVKEDIAVYSLPSHQIPQGGSVMIKKGMMIRSIESSDSKESKQLKNELPFAADGEAHLKRLCEHMGGGALQMTFHVMPDEEPLFEEDCAALQASCMAESYGPDTNSWWPPDKLWNHNLEGRRTVCIYKPLSSMVTMGQRVWRVLHNKELDGLTCPGKPLATLYIRGEEPHKCQKACMAREPCSYVFFGPNDTTIGAHREPESGVGDLRLEDLGAGEGDESGVRGGGLLHRCLLYESCSATEQPDPAAKLDTAGQFQEVDCTQSQCGPFSNLPCRALNSAIVAAPGVVLHAKGCEDACLNLRDPTVQCNAYTFNPLEGTCTLHGPRLLETLKQEHFHKVIPPTGQRLPKPGMLGAETSKCLVRRSPAPANRWLARGPGILLQWSDSYMCTGCTPRAISEYLFNPSNFSTFFGHLVTFAGILYIAKSAHDAFQSGRVVFSGRPIVHMAVVQDLANPVGFEEREAAFVEFLTKCAQVAGKLRSAITTREEDLDDEEGAVSDDCEAEVVEHETYDDYELTNDFRTEVIVDRRLLSLFPEEAIIGTWLECQRHGLVFPLLILLLFAISWYCGFMATPYGLRNYPRFWFTLGVLIAVFFVVHEYVQLRRETQGICVVTSFGRIVQLSRRPPPCLFGAFLGGTDVRLDTFHVGRLAHLQLDMVAVPMWQDWVLSTKIKAWRRGVVTMRGEHGLLEVQRTSGEVTHVYQVLSSLVDAKRTSGLRPITCGDLDLAGLVPSKDLLAPEEEHIWETRLNEYGFVSDPFNYSSILTVTDRRILVSRLRCPKPTSLRGLLLGPRTCGLRCMFLQEWLGHHACISATCIGHNNVQSYATMRTQMPPFWPGFMAPVHSVGVVLLTKFMSEYPASLTVAQRPYGIPRRIRVRREVRLHSTEFDLLKIAFTDQPGAPRGHMVVEVLGPDGQQVPLDDERWEAADGGEVEIGSTIVLEPCDPEWQGSADEPWLRKLRHILDYILGRAEVPEEVWQDMAAPPPLPDPSCLTTGVFQRVFGGEMLGLHVQTSSISSAVRDAGSYQKIHDLEEKEDDEEEP